MAEQKNFVVKNGLQVGDSASIAGVLVASGITYPTSDGSANQVFVTDGSGNLTLQTVSYDNLSNKPTLGTAAATNATAYATAAQGALADTATQPADVATAIANLVDTAPSTLDTLN